MRGMFRIRRLARLPGPMTLQCAWSLGAANWHPTAAADQTTGSTAIIGAQPDCFKWALPVAGTMKLIVSVPQGQGLAAAQVFEK